MTKLLTTPVRTAAVAALLALLAAFTAGAQTPPRLLSDVDVVKFARDFKQIAEDLDRLGSDIAPDLEKAAGFGAMLGGLRGNTEVQKVLAKYGWGNAAFPKFAAIMASYFVVKLEEGQQQAAPELAKAMADIDGNTALTADQKATFKAQMAMVGQQLTQVQAVYKAQVHPEDIAVVRAHATELDAVFDQ
jgi:hypothetical protein